MAIRRRPPTHPGTILKEHYLDPRGATIVGFADAVGISRKHLSQIIHGRAGITADTALRLAEALETTPQLWLNLQNAVDVHYARERLQAGEGRPVRPRAFPAPDARSE